MWSCMTHAVARPFMLGPSLHPLVPPHAGTFIVTKGQYYPPGTPRNDKEKPIFLKITPGAGAGQV